MTSLSLSTTGLLFKRSSKCLGGKTQTWALSLFCLISSQPGKTTIGCTYKFLPVQFLSLSCSQYAWDLDWGTEFFGRREEPTKILSPSYSRLWMPWRLLKVLVSIMNTPCGPIKTWSMLNLSAGMSWMTRNPSSRSKSKYSATALSPSRPCCSCFSLWSIRLVFHAAKIETMIHKTVGTQGEGRGLRKTHLDHSLKLMANSRTAKRYGGSKFVNNILKTSLVIDCPGVLNGTCLSGDRDSSLVRLFKELNRLDIFRY